MSPRKDGQHRNRMVPSNWEDSPGIEAILLGLRGDPTAIDHIVRSSGIETVAAGAGSGDIAPGTASQLITALEPVVAIAGNDLYVDQAQSVITPFGPAVFTPGGLQDISPSLTQQLITGIGPVVANAEEGDDELAVTRLTSDTVLSASGVYVIDTSVGNRTITLPILSGTPSEGYRIQVIREGAFYVYLQTNPADDYWDSTTQRTLFDPFSAVSVAADDALTSWLELGRWKTVT